MPNSLQTSWPEWTNGPLELYHGTHLKFAESIMSGGIDVSRSRPRTAFGRGFYTTTSLQIAQLWSKQVSLRAGESASAIVRVQIDRPTLSQLASLCFVRHSMEAKEYWSFVQHCRRGLPHHPSTLDFYDIVYGPIARLWAGPSKSSTFVDSDQISFHSGAAQAMLNDESVCKVEVFA